MDGGDDLDRMIEWAAEREQELIELELERQLEAMREAEAQLQEEWREYERFMRASASL